MLEFYLIIFFLGTILTGIGVFKLKRFNKLLSEGIRTTGKVVDIKKKWSGAEHQYSYPVFEFETKKQMVKVESSIGTTGTSYEINEQVNILYEEDFPSNAEIFSIFRFEVIPRIFLTTGIIVLTIGFLQLFEVINIEF